MIVVNEKLNTPFFVIKQIYLHINFSISCDFLNVEERTMI